MAMPVYLSSAYALSLLRCVYTADQSPSNSCINPLHLYFSLLTVMRCLHCNLHCNRKPPDVIPLHLALRALQMRIGAKVLQVFEEQFGHRSPQLKYTAWVGCRVIQVPSQIQHSLEMNDALCLVPRIAFVTCTLTLLLAYHARPCASWLTMVKKQHG